MNKFDVETINRITFTEGSIQTSPQYLQKLNLSPPVAYIPSGLRSAPSAGYQVFLSGYAQYVFEQESRLEQVVSLHKAINRLRSIPRPLDNGFVKKDSIDTRKYESESFNIWYRVNNGQILVFNIEANKSLYLSRARNQKPGLYRVKRVADGVWESQSVKSVDTNYAAVNGMNNDLTKAKWLLGQHLEKEFGKAAVNEFTLFHNPSVGSTGDFWESVRDKIGVTTDVTRMFSNVLQDAQKGSKEVKWVAHSQGGIIFSEAVRYFLNGNSSWAITGGFNGAFKDKDNVSLDKHSVSFHGNGNNNIRTSILLKRAQVDVISVRANDYDLVYVVAGMNTLSPRRIVGSAVHWNHVFGGSVQQSPHTQMQTQKEWEKNMQSGPGKGRGPIQKAFKYIENYLK